MGDNANFHADDATADITVAACNSPVDLAGAEILENGEGTNEYMLMRMKNIQQNQSILENLGIERPPQVAARIERPPQVAAAKKTKDSKLATRSSERMCTKKNEVAASSAGMSSKDATHLNNLEEQTEALYKYLKQAKKPRVPEANWGSINYRPGVQLLSELPANFAELAPFLKFSKVYNHDETNKFQMDAVRNPLTLEELTNISHMALGLTSMDLCRQVSTTAGLTKDLKCGICVDKICKSTTLGSDGVGEWLRSVATSTDQTTIYSNETALMIEIYPITVEMVYVLLNLLIGVRTCRGCMYKVILGMNTNLYAVVCAMREKIHSEPKRMILNMQNCICKSQLKTGILCGAMTRRATEVVFQLVLCDAQTRELGLTARNAQNIKPRMEKHRPIFMAKDADSALLLNKEYDQKGVDTKADRKRKRQETAAQQESDKTKEVGAQPVGKGGGAQQQIAPTNVVAMGGVAQATNSLGMDGSVKANHSLAECESTLALGAGLSTDQQAEFDNILRDFMSEPRIK